MISPFYFVSLPKIRTNNLNTMLMKRKYPLLLLLCCFLLAHQKAKADNEVVFLETFAGCNGTGGTDETFGGTAGSGDLVYDNEGWTADKCGGGSQCIKYGTSSAIATLSTPHISLKEGTTAILTFKAAGWKKNDTDNTKNTLTVSSEGCTVSGDISLNNAKTDKQLVNGEWTTYTVTISDITGPITIKFSGKRGFLDDVKIVGEKGGEITVTVPEPTLTEEFTFWSNTIEPTKRIVTITPAESTSVRYTTDGTEPSLTEGTEIKAATSLFIWGTTTIKAIAIKSIYTSEVITKTYTLGKPVNSLTEFCALAEDTQAQLFINTEQNARITAVNGKQFTVKDDAEATLLFDFGDVAFNPTPVVQQQIAGWIIGKKQTVEGSASFIATGLTTPAYMAFANPIKDATGVQTINAQQKATDDTYYTLSGQRVKSPKKGIYIVNSKKLIIH